MLTILHKALEQAGLNAKIGAQEEVDARRKALWESGIAHIDNGDAPKSRVVLKRLADEFGHEEDMLLNIGKKFLDHKLYPDALEFLEPALEAFPKQSQIYAHLITCYTAMGEMEKVEKIYLAALKQFGAHPKTLLKFARFYMDWNKREQAFDQALAVLRLEPDNAEAKELCDRAEGKRYKRYGK